MAHVDQLNNTTLQSLARNIPDPVLWAFRGIGQVFFQENALTGALFALGIAVSSPLMALGAVVGAAIGTATAWILKFDNAELRAGIYGFNATLVGIATLFFFRPGPISVMLLLAGCVVATVVTWLARKHVPFPTYTAPFVVTTWAVYFLGVALVAPRVEPGAALEGVGSAVAVAHGVSQVMFQASLWTAILFLAGIAINDWKHACWVLLGSIVGMLVGTHHSVVATKAVDPESLANRTILDNVALGLYGYNATLAAVALFLWRRSLIPPLLGMLISVPITELFPALGVPALTAPFVLATWLVLAAGWLDGRLFPEQVKTVD
jgi:urea transporter